MIAGSIIAVLALIAVVHGFWGARVWWPIADEATLTVYVIGAKGAVRMPPALACFGVSALMALGIIWVMLLAQWFVVLPQSLVMIGGIVMGTVFMVRGGAAYFPPFARITPQPEFRRMDTRVYGPLCLVIGAGVLALALIPALT